VLPTVLTLSATLTLIFTVAVSSARTIDSYDAGAPRVSRSPSGPPLAAPGPISSLAADASASAPPSAGDPLVENGLGSPLCRRAAPSLSVTSQRNCETSGFEAAAAPTANYAFDVHIDTSLFSINFGMLVQDYLLSPVWMGLVWLIHAVVVALEWCYTINLLDSSAMGALTSSLRETQASFTQPWLVLALAGASVMATYHGLIRRRVADTVSQVMMMLLMMAAGLWVIMNPAGTVGALEDWANQASLGTLGTVAQGTPDRGPKTLADSMRAMFSSVIGGPWCYMEFGDVGWCANPARRDPRLYAAALRIARSEQSAIGCPPVSLSLTACAPRGSKQAQALQASVRLLRQADTNGDVFLALPANQSARNSINSSSSLLRLLCGSDNPTGCRGATAELAEFRTQSGTAARLEGLLLISIGALGMVLLFGFLAMRLLGAAIVGIFYLMLAPAAVLAPAFGDGGRAAFRLWASHLLGSVVSKVIYSFLLGVLLLMTRILMGLNELGWWTQWLLVSCLWWGVFRNRHQVLSFAHGQVGAYHEQAQPLGSRIRHALGTSRELGRMAGWTKDRLSRPGPTGEPPRSPRPTTRSGSRPAPDKQVSRVMARERLAANAVKAARPDIEARIVAQGERLERIRGQQRLATDADNPRRAARLDLRAERVEEGILAERGRVAQARRFGTRGDGGESGTREVRTNQRAEEYTRFLDAQAALPAARDRLRRGEIDGAHNAAPRRRRDYVALASLVGYGREEYERLDPRRRREARLEIDRELEARRRTEGVALGAVAGLPNTMTARERSGPEKEVARAAEYPRRENTHDLPRSHTGQSPRSDRANPPAGASSSRESTVSPPESTVMRDAREVAQRRKRQLGR
jgi:hypothetical protein